MNYVGSRRKAKRRKKKERKESRKKDGKKRKRREGRKEGGGGGRGTLQNRREWKSRTKMRPKGKRKDYEEGRIDKGK